jgi:hypothetical protein
VEADLPSGFYIRRLPDGLWLRGYVASDDHVWDPDDHFIFCIRDESTLAAQFQVDTTVST